MSRYSYRVELAAEEMDGLVQRGNTRLRAAWIVTRRNGLSDNERSDMWRVYQAMKGRSDG